MVIGAGDTDLALQVIPIVPECADLQWDGAERMRPLMSTPPPPLMRAVRYLEGGPKFMICRVGSVSVEFKKLGNRKLQ